MSNIAEGFDRYSIKKFRHFISTARGSVAEIRSQACLAEELEYITSTEASSTIDLCVETGLILGGLRKSLERKTYPEQVPYYLSCTLHSAPRTVFIESYSALCTLLPPPLPSQYHLEDPLYSWC